MRTTDQRVPVPREDAARAAGSDGESRPMTRREALRGIGLLAAGLGLGCTPARIVLRAYPKTFDDKGLLVDRVLRAFVTTVIPGAPSDEANLVRAFHDEFYPFEPYTSFFASDLCRRADSRYGVRFDLLSLERRTRIVQEGLKADGTTRRLYTAAIFLAQISFYSGIYDEERGCPFIDFDGRFELKPLDQLTYSNPETYLADPVTDGGNFV